MVNLGVFQVDAQKPFSKKETAFQRFHYTQINIASVGHIDNLLQLMWSIIDASFVERCVVTACGGEYTMY